MIDNKLVKTGITSWYIANVRYMFVGKYIDALIVMKRLSERMIVCMYRVKIAMKPNCYEALLLSLRRIICILFYSFLHLFCG